MKQQVVTIILVLFLCNFCTVHGAIDPTRIANRLQTLFQQYYSSSFLWQTVSHYMNKSELALPGFSKMFNEFAIIDRKYADRLLELTAQYGLYFTSYDIRTNLIVTNAEKNYELSKNCEGRHSTVCKNNRERYPYCKQVPFTDLKFSFLISKGKDKTHLRTYEILKLAYVIDVCYLMLNLDISQETPHLRYTLVKKFATEQTHRRKYIRDLLEKLESGDLLAELIVDRTLRSIPY